MPKKPIKKQSLSDKQYKVLLLTSYCGGDNKGCSDNMPCINCIAMCNTYLIDKHAIKSDNYSGTLNYLDS